MFNFLKKGLEKTIKTISSLSNKDGLNSEILEEMLLEADVEYDIVEEILSRVSTPKNIEKEELREILKEYFIYDFPTLNPSKPQVDLIIGVNGAGKTTTIAKLANLYKKDGKKVILGASDTFRAGAIEQLKLWAKKIDVPIVATNQGHDPAAVAFDTISSAIAKDYDNVLIDTAGRLQNQKNLANELSKIVRICARAKDGKPDRKILILDGTQGHSGVLQARAFNEIVSIDGVIITKLDGTPKGGALFSVARDLKVPILFVGVGEKMEDLVPFDANDFINQILEAIFTQK
jgi:fused signal recognition particle receptor